MAKLRHTAMLSALLLLLGAMTAGAKEHSDSNDSPRKSPLAISGYSGGMMVHSGYVSAGNVTFTPPNGGVPATAKISGAPLGIGGALKIHFGKYLRIGTEGYSSNLKYGKHGSYEHVGWGGLLIDGILPLGRWFPFAGLTIGGGGVKNVTAFQDTIDDFTLDDGTTSYRKYTFMAIAPFVGIEYALTGRIHLVMKADWLFDATSRQSDFMHGPRVYIGFMFCH